MWEVYGWKSGEEYQEFERYVFVKLLRDLWKVDKYYEL